MTLITEPTSTEEELTLAPAMPLRAVSAYTEPMLDDRPAPSSSTAPPARLVSLDAFRGLVMVLMVSAGLGIGQVVRTFDRTPELQHLKTPLWQRLAFHTDHTAWSGCSLWDLIQPSFMFMVGAAMAFSLASRRAKGHKFGRMLGHAIVRSLVLVLLAIVLTSNWSKSTEWVFTNVLAQIGLGYTFLFLVAWLKPRWQITTAAGILLVYWAVFAFYPKPPVDLDVTTVGLPATWDRLHGFASHWEKNTNLAAAFDRWFLNRFPRVEGKPFTFNTGGYETLNFVPSLVTMILGLLAGGLIRGPRSPGAKVAIMLAIGAVGLAAGWCLDWAGICPMVKRIWTPSWTLFSAGWAFLSLAVFYLIIDVARLKAWAFPLVVVGMNSIAVYCISMVMKPWVRETLQRHFGHDVYSQIPEGFARLLRRFGANVDVGIARTYAPMVDAGLFLLFCWLVCWWMYRRKMFVRI